MTFPLVRMTRRRLGFTLLEVMAVVLILGSVLLIVPLNMGGWGARSRLELGANSIVAAMRGTREQAVEDGYDAYLELGWTKLDGSDEERAAFRVKFTSVPSDKASGEDDESREERERQRSREREWLYSEWRPLPDGLEWAGVSERKDSWRNISKGGKAYSIHFDAGGNADKSLGVRVRSLDLDTDDDQRTVTIILNGLTSEPSWIEGRQEIRESLDQNNFNY